MIIIIIHPQGILSFDIIGLKGENICNFQFPTAIHHRHQHRIHLYDSFVALIEFRVPSLAQSPIGFTSSTFTTLGCTSSGAKDVKRRQSHPHWGSDNVLILSQVQLLISEVMTINVGEIQFQEVRSLIGSNG